MYIADQQANNIKSFYKKKVKRNIVVLVILVALTVIFSIISLSLGGANTGIKNVLALISNTFGAHSPISELSRVVLIHIRIPRILMGILVGVALSNAGLLMQAIFQNPLVSPYTLGVSSGAAFGAALSIILGWQFTALGQYSLPISAFLMSIVTIAVVYGVSMATKSAGKNIILIGVAVGYFFSALLYFLQYTSNVKALASITYWMMGSLANMNYSSVLIMFAVDTVSIGIMIFFAWDLNMISYGKDTAISFGVNYELVKFICIIISTLLTATAVAFTGIIGFIGLVAPQMTRMFIGSDYRFLIPGSCLVGALLVVVSDMIARTVMYPVDLPIGVITSFVGVPFFLYLVMRKKA
ncbi:MAG: FecCD family ABC transporter permease [Sarcina sp.]